MWIYRLLGLALAVVGASVLAFITYALYTLANFGLVVLVRLGMPTVLIATSAGIILVGFGIWLAGFNHPIHSKRAGGA